jgi:hypothetical protein
MFYGVHIIIIIISIISFGGWSRAVERSMQSEKTTITNRSLQGLWIDANTSSTFRIPWYAESLLKAS